MKATLANLSDRILTVPAIRRRYLHATRQIVPILLFHRAADREHGIGGYEPEAIKGFLDRIEAAGIRAVGLEEILDYRADLSDFHEPMIAFTADDGYADQASVLGEIFAQRELPLTIFLITDFIDGILWPWDAKIHYAFRQTDRPLARISVGRLELDFDLSSESKRTGARREFQLICKSLAPDALASALNSMARSLEVEIPDSPPTQYRPMTWQQARNLESQGVTFAPHSRSHQVLSRLSDDHVRQEIEQSWRRVSEEMQRPLRVFAWPVGGDHDFGVRETRIAGSLGFATTLAARHRLSTLRAAGMRSGVLERIGFNVGESNDPTWRETTGVRRVVHDRDSADKRFKRYASRDSLGGLASRPTRRSGRRVRAKALLSMVQARAGVYRRPASTELGEVQRLVFVCQGNICRSPYAEALARNVGIPTVSCGLGANGIAAADQIAARVAYGRGVDLSGHQSTNVKDIDFRAGDLVLGMQPSHLSHVEQYIAGVTDIRTSLLGLWARPPRPWIEDPYGLAPEAFERVFDILEESVTRLGGDLAHVQDS